MGMKESKRPFKWGARDVLFILFLVANFFAVWTILWLHQTISQPDSPENIRTRSKLDKLDRLG